MRGQEDTKIVTASQAVVRMQLVGTNPEPEIMGLNELSGKSHYLIGNNPQKWHTHIPTYTKVQYRNVYPGVGLVYYGNQQQLEYDFVVTPGADPKVINLAFEGPDNIQIDPEGNLILQIAGGKICFYKPRVYQEMGGTKQIIPGSYIRLNPEMGNEQWTKIGFQ